MGTEAILPLARGHSQARQGRLQAAPPQQLPREALWAPSASGMQKAWPSHFLFHLMGIRPDSGAVRLAIFRVRLCNFVEGMTKVRICSFQGGQR